MVPLEQSPAARSLDVFVIQTLAAEAARKLDDQHVCFCVELIAGKYGVSVDVFRGREVWTATQILGGGRSHLVACSHLPLSK